MIGLPSGTQIWVACGVTDLRNGFIGLAALVQTQLAEDAISGQVFIFRGRRGDRVKLLWFDNGTMTSRAGKTISWYSYNLPNLINYSTNSTQ